ncbi:hypothetical protein M438DRAFT_360214 [Aureobasidium pullulans EXF-150]|uniref:Uncharacterized protein n=1 Tax=Aureobasidium pullulans EXF-150 TaxID=1043002 RepID=A0A074X004_AURPU|nr:uncharacterized protein M438DRAFT_360214 [Aureobasidium pullulans EXF-150]KEQ78780.1 hypothetical protein M438DRAFT_360214 [Aureobasidium pullulans EXF-150]
MPSSSVLLSIDVPEVSRQHGCSVRGPTRAHYPAAQTAALRLRNSTMRTFWQGPDSERTWPASFMALSLADSSGRGGVLAAGASGVAAPAAGADSDVERRTGREVLDKHRNTQSGLVWYLLLATKIKGSKEYLQGHRQIASPCKACLADIRDQKNVFEELLPWAEYKGQEPTVQHDRYRDTGNIWKHRSEDRMFEECDVLKARVVLRYRMCLMIEADQVDSNNT